ncbi:acyl carrier protein [Campylobacter lari]|uniref:acyl carrier protein n=2 Tax=unclassified Campylobacter TaxID=2593542 RepID=UPI001274E712|nr:acyl carrier protein [Campylobacter sp. FU_520]EAL5741258.1 acyl carrier protein [Campylobacter lari]MCR8712988.1 acyl carrier protein [Campylobacter sp. W0066.1]EGG0462993.1 acyl carrier protein [Campylobacter lari]EGK7514996.1 acyl carrier protein [Campylobacter lari]EGK8097803.1 acyl carrier protein [Campylobacter lari]
MKIDFSDIQNMFNAINRSDINENSRNLVDDDIIDSMDMMKLILEIEKFIGKNLDAKYITPDNFEDFSAIKNMLEEVI